MKPIILIVLLASLATGCRHNREEPTPNPGANGHYLVTPRVVKGTCDQPEPLVLVIWHGDVTDDGVHGAFDITGTLSGLQLDGIATDGEGNVVTFDAVLAPDNQTLQGEWYDSTGECAGNLSGVRV